MSKFTVRFPQVCLSLFFGLAVIATSAPMARAQITPFTQVVAAEATSDAAVAAFYRERDYQPIWTSAADAGRRQALFAALDGAAAHGLPVARYDVAGLRARFDAALTLRHRARIEVAMSVAFLAYAQDIRSGVLVPITVDPGIVRSVLVRDRLVVLREFAASASPQDYLRSLPPKAPQYVPLMRAKLDLEGVVARGGWGPAVRADKLELGDKGPEVIALRDRMIALGYLRRSAVAEFDVALEKAVQLFQIENGLASDGVAGEGTIDEINRSPEERLQSVVVAMERLRWMNGLELGKRHIWVNLPDFTAKIIDDGKVTFETLTVVGMNQADRRSPEFSDQMEYMVINPTWFVPRLIAVKEYLPMLKADPNAVSHLKLVDSRGRVVDRATHDFTQYTAGNFPFSMSQAPSNNNALGLVKFIFPNADNIYMHDTPQKSLFLREIRAFSHGCIRLQKPFDFAYALLAVQSANPEAEFASHLNTRRETTVPLQSFVPVHIVYFTAWPTPRGRMTYRRDVYGRDGRIFDALEAAGVSLGSVQG